MRRTGRRGVGVFGLALFLSVWMSSWVSVSWGGTICVEQDGSGDYRVLQDAADAAAPGDTILIGAGRYLEYRPYDFGALTEDTYLVIDKPNLTVMGVDRDSVIIGPEVYDWASPLEPNGISASSDSIAGLVVVGLTVENLPAGIVALGGIRVDDCVIRGCRLGVSAHSTAPVLISRTSFLDSRDVGAIFLQPASGMRVTACRFESGGLVFQGQTDALVSGCTFVRVGGNAQQYSDVTLEDCTFLEGAGFGAIESTMRLYRNWFNADPGTRITDINGSATSTVIGEYNRFGGGGFSAMNFTWNTTVRLHFNHILRAGSSMLVTTSSYPDPTTVVDLRNNWWGTTDTLLIDGLIEDGVDTPGEAPSVQWKPYLDAPVPTRQEHVGSLKARY